MTRFITAMMFAVLLLSLTEASACACMPVAVASNSAIAAGSLIVVLSGCAAPAPQYVDICKSEAQQAMDRLDCRGVNEAACMKAKGYDVQ